MGGDKAAWRCGAHVIELRVRTLIMGVVNVTPDSFSDGGTYGSPDDAVRHAVEMAGDGADLLDIGGESTRPGSDPVPADEEAARVLPTVERLARELPDVPISVDTRKPEVARAALEAGASIVNDISAGAAPGMFDVVRASGAGSLRCRSLRLHRLRWACRPGMPKHYGPSPSHPSWSCRFAISAATPTRII